MQWRKRVWVNAGENAEAVREQPSIRARERDPSKREIHWLVIEEAAHEEIRDGSD
jgi:hypothetical protein